MKTNMVGALALVAVVGGWASVSAALDINFIALPNDRNRADMVADYEASTNKGDYHLAVAPNGAWSSQWRSANSKWTDDDVRRNTLQKCEHYAGEPCGFVVEAGAAVSTYAPQASGLVYGGSFDADKVPFVSAAARRELAADYANAPRQRALAIHRNGSYAYRYRNNQARAEALAACEGFSKSKDCFIYDVNGTVEFTKDTPLRNPG